MAQLAGRTSDEQDSTTALRGQIFLASLIIMCLFISDHVLETKTGKHLLDGTIVGVIVGGIIGWFNGINGYFFPARQRNNGPNETTSPNPSKEDPDAKK